MKIVDTGELDQAPRPRRYDRAAAFQAYCAWLDHDEPEALDRLLRYAKRFCIMWINKSSKTLTLESREEMLNHCLLGLWRSFRNKVIERRVGALHGYMRTTALNSRKWAARNFWGKDLQKIGREEYMRRYCARLPDDRTMEAEIFIKELPGALRRRAIRWTRFTEPNVLGGLQYIINRLTRRERVVAAWLYDEYGIERGLARVKFLTEHAIILLRMEMYWMRQNEVTFRSDEEKRHILDVGFEPYVTEFGGTVWPV